MLRYRPGAAVEATWRPVAAADDGGGSSGDDGTRAWEPAVVENDLPHLETVLVRFRKNRTPVELPRDAVRPAIGAPVERGRRHNAPELPWELNIFDFDGTLFRSPVLDPMRWENAARDRFYAKPGRYNGLGWFQHPASLSPPFVPEVPGPEWFNPAVVECVRRSKRHRGCVTVLLTGRFEHMRPRIEQILQAHDLEFDFVGFNHMPDEKTEAAKLAHMTALLQQHRGVRSVNVWEDREYQLRAFVPWLAARRAERRISRYEAFQVMHGESHLPEAVEQALCAELVRSDHARRREQSLGQPPRALPTIARAVVGVNIAVPPTDAALAQLLAHLHSWPLPSHWTVGPFRLLLEHNVPRRSHATLTGQAVTVTLAAYRIGAAGLVAEIAEASWLEVGARWGAHMVLPRRGHIALALAAGAARLHPGHFIDDVPWPIPPEVATLTVTLTVDAVTRYSLIDTDDAAVADAPASQAERAEQGQDDALLL